MLRIFSVYLIGGVENTYSSVICRVLLKTMERQLMLTLIRNMQHFLIKICVR